MAARPAEKWAARAFLALAHSRLDLPPGIGRQLQRARGSMHEMASIAHLLGHMSFPELEPMMDDLMSCISFVVSPGPPPVTRPLHDAGDANDDIEEIATRQRLRSEVVDLHLGFSLPGAIFNLIALGSTTTEISEPSSSTTQTSRRRSRSS